MLPKWRVAEGQEVGVAALILRASLSFERKQQQSRFREKYGVRLGVLVSRPSLSSALLANLASAANMATQNLLEYFEVCEVGAAFLIAVCQGAGRLPGGAGQARDLCMKHTNNLPCRVRVLAAMSRCRRALHSCLLG
jgi:hypothetical protein